MKKKLKMCYLINPIQVIQKWKTGIHGKLCKKNSPLDGLTVTLSPGEKAFTAEFERPSYSPKQFDVGKKFARIGFQNLDDKIVFEHLWILRHQPPTFSADIDFFHTLGYSKKRRFYNRLIVPLSSKLNFHDQITEIGISSDLFQWSRNATQAIIAGDKFTAYIFTDKNQDTEFLAIESEVKLNYDEFSEKAFALKNAIGYLTGYLAGNGGYFFAYNHKDMNQISHYYYCSFRDTIRSGYNPININPYAILHHKRTVAEGIYKKKMLMPVTLEQLSILTNKLYASLEFTSAVILLLESSVASLLFMPGGFAIVLESLSDLIIGEDKLKLAPIQDKSKSRDLRKKFRDIISHECANLAPEDLKVLITRIDQINQITNGSRLKAPFTKLGITLLERDMEVLRSRNDFLHGRIPDISKTVANPGLDEKNRDLYYASLRFYTLINMLIMKWIGYENFVINYPKIYEDYCRIKLNEHFYRKL